MTPWWLVRLVSDPSQCGWVPSASLERRPSTCWPSPPSSDHRHAEEGRGQDAKFRREALRKPVL
ncbi:hypothetical protein FOCC_FOCC000011 [Frankliniella occidentalis]|nr:hypothetical protein FOCC_FOCC000011 [Frankliniella occidentalis]